MRAADLWQIEQRGPCPQCGARVELAWRDGGRIVRVGLRGSAHDCSWCFGFYSALLEQSRRHDLRHLLVTMDDAAESRTDDARGAPTAESAPAGGERRSRRPEAASSDAAPRTHPAPEPPELAA